jgi:hypothetical protein
MTTNHNADGQIRCQKTDLVQLIDRARGAGLVRTAGDVASARAQAVSRIKTSAAIAAIKETDRTSRLAAEIEGRHAAARDARPLDAVEPVTLAQARANWRASRAEQAAAEAAEAQREALARVRRIEAARAAGVWDRDTACGGLGEGLAASPVRRAIERGDTAARASQTRANASRIFNGGRGARLAARAVAIAERAATRWMRRNARREALALPEIGSAAGVDDLGAGANWLEEVRAEYRAIYLAAAAQAAAVLDATANRPHACRMLIRRAMIAHRVGIIWREAATAAAQAAHTLRYGARGRDGREVAGDWSITGNMPGAITGSPDQSAGVGPRCPDLAARVRGAAADMVRDARRKAREARQRLAAEREAGAASIAARNAVNNAARAEASAIDRARLLADALRGDMSAEDLARLTEPNGRLTFAGYSLAKAIRSAVAGRV